MQGLYVFCVHPALINLPSFSIYPGAGGCTWRESQWPWNIEADLTQSSDIIPWARRCILQGRVIGVPVLLYSKRNSVRLINCLSLSASLPLTPCPSFTGNSIIISNIALCFMVALLVYLGPVIVGKYYLIPYLVRHIWDFALKVSANPMRGIIAYEPLVTTPSCLNL